MGMLLLPHFRQDLPAAQAFLARRMGKNHANPRHIGQMEDVGTCRIAGQNQPRSDAKL
jgi:hypothetical protein